MLTLCLLLLTGDAELIGDPLADATSAADVAATDDFFGGAAAQPTSSEDFFANGGAVPAAEGSGDSSATDVNEAEAFGTEAAGAADEQATQQYSLEEVSLDIV